MIKPPNIKTEVLSQKSIKSSFLSIEEINARFHYPDGSTAEMQINALGRKLQDAVVIIPYQYDFSFNVEVYLRSALRPPLAVKDYNAVQRPESPDIGNLWELPAGLVDADELGASGLIKAAARELYEETGFNIPEWKIEPLGHRVFSSPGFSAERLYFFAVHLDYNEPQGKPIEDGSPLEKGGIVESFPLKDLLDNENIYDAKTEIGLWRLARKLSRK